MPIISPSEKRCFDALLPLLTPAARATVHSIIRTPGTSPYTRVREALLRRFGRTPRQLARDLCESRSLGDKLPSEFLDHLLGLLPDVKVLFEVILLDALPANARVAALPHTDVHAMARAADTVVLENRASAEVDRASAAIAAVSVAPADEFPPSQLSPAAVALPAVAAVSRGSRPPLKKTDTLCAVHAR